jgi:hypothetical protein
LTRHITPRTRKTRLARLFADEARGDLDAVRGPFNRVFDRMLFLTATPLQLSHDELIEILRRFTGVRWADLDRGRYESDLERLENALDSTQASGLRLDRAWARLAARDLDDLPLNWWATADPDALGTLVGLVAVTWRETRERRRAAQRALQPFVIRHVRPDRDVLCGAAIRQANGGGRERGLEVGGAAVPPFMLAARAITRLDAQLA